MMHFDETGKYVKFADTHNSESYVFDDHLLKRSSGVCRRKCSQYRSLTTRYENNQKRCKKCDIFITLEGTKGGEGLFCKCCNLLVSDGNDNYSSEKKSAPVYEDIDESVKTFYEFNDFLENNLRPQANYQYVMLHELLISNKLHKGQIAESLAYFNNKDTTDIDEVKYYLAVPVYDVLVNSGFVNKHDPSESDTVSLPYYSLNVKLEEMQRIQLLEYLLNQITKYNQEHDIPIENEFPESNNKENFSWSSVTPKKLIKKVAKKAKVKPEPTVDSKYRKFKNIFKKSNSTHSRWIWSVTPKNWEILKSQNIWGSRISKEQIRERIKSGDQVAFYVVGTSRFQGIFEFVGDWYDSPGKTWDGDLRPDGSLIYVSQIQIKSIQLGTIKIHNLHEKLEIFIGKSPSNRNLVLQGGNGYPSNNSRPLSEDDFTIIRTELMRNRYDLSDNGIKTLIENEITPTFAKTCPKCKETLVTASLKQEFEEKIEESFGYRQRDPNDPDSKIPQSYCRECRTSQILTQYLADRKSDESLESDVVNTKIFKFDDGEVNIQNCKVLSTDTIKKDQILSNDKIMELFKVGNMRGIRYTKYNDVIILLSTLSDDYDDSIDLNSGFIIYTGEGKGDQEIKNGNEKIRNSQNTSMIFFKEVYQEPGSRPRGALDNKYKFIGVVRYHKHYWATEKGRKVIKFVLEIVS